MKIDERGGEGEGRHRQLAGSVRTVETDVDTCAKELVLDAECSSSEESSENGSKLSDHARRLDFDAAESQPEDRGSVEKLKSDGDDVERSPDGDQSAEGDWRELWVAGCWSSDSGASSDGTIRRALHECLEDESLAEPEELDGASELSPGLRQFLVPGLAETERRFRGMGI